MTLFFIFLGIGHLIILVRNLWPATKEVEIHSPYTPEQTRELTRLWNQLSEEQQDNCLRKMKNRKIERLVSE